MVVTHDHVVTLLFDVASFADVPPFLVNMTFFDVPSDVLRGDASMLPSFAVMPPFLVNVTLLFDLASFAVMPPFLVDLASFDSASLLNVFVLAFSVLFATEVAAQVQTSVSLTLTLLAVAVKVSPSTLLVMEANQIRVECLVYACNVLDVAWT